MEERYITEALKEAQTTYVELRQQGMDQKTAIIFSSLFSTIQAEFPGVSLAETDRIIASLISRVQWQID